MGRPRLPISVGRATRLNWKCDDIVEMPSWIESLKKWNEGKGTWCIPRKGSEAYMEVRALMNPGEEPAIPKKAPKVPAEIREMIRNAKEDYDRLDMRDKATVLGALEKYKLRAPTVMKKDFNTWMTSRAQEKAVMAKKKTTGKGRSRMEYYEY